MTIRLTVERERWWQHVTDVAREIDGLVPVVKGNGYGFGRVGLARLAIKLSPLLAVGTIHELSGLPPEATPIVLTPSLIAPPSVLPVLTVSNSRHIEALRSWDGRVIVKLESSMRRFGGGLELVDQAYQAGIRVVGVAIHPPIEGDDDQHRADIERWLPDIDPNLDVWVSHLAPVTYQTLPTTHRYKLRCGSYLWHGDRGALKLEADVLEVRPVSAEMLVGYHQIPVPGDGTLVIVGAGSANGVAPLADGRSPFHFAQQRIDLVELPHMHSSTLFVPAGSPTPAVGDWVDLQRPLISTHIDELRWI